MANVIAGLAAQLGLDTTEFKKGIGEAKSSLKELKEYLPEALSAAAFYELIHASFELSNKIVETAKANEVATESVLRLSHALEENGGNAEDVSRIYSGFTQKIEAAVQGNLTAQTSFAKLGVTLRDLGTLSEQDLFEKTVKGLSNMKDAAERNGLAFQTLGKSIRGVDLKGLAETLDESKGKYDKYAEAVEKAHEMSLKLEASHKQLVLNFTVALIPSLATLYDSYTKVGGAMDKIADAAKYVGMVLVVTIKEITTAASDAWAVLKGVGLWLYNVSHLDFAKAGESLKDIGKDIVQNGQDFTQFVRDVLKANEPLKEVHKQNIETHREVTAAYSKELKAAEALSAAYKKQSELNLEALRHKEETLNLTKHEKEIQDEVNKVYENRDKALANIEDRINKLDMTKLGSKEILTELKKQSEAIRQATGEYVAGTIEAVKANQRMREDFGFGWDQAFNQYKENALTAADYGRQSFQAVTSAMDSALSNFVKTGKINFKSFAQSVIQDLIAIQLKMQATQIFSGSGSGFLGAIGQALKGINPISYFNQTTGSGVTNQFNPGIDYRASGGPVNDNSPYIVGEQGPELFVPKGSGTIVPNGSLSSMGSTTNVTNYNISAIDTKSFEDRIYGSANAIWAANTYAQKNLAINRSRT